MTKKRTPSGGYAQDWAAHYKAQINEKRLFLTLLYELCQEVKGTIHAGSGRPPYSMRDMVFSVILKVYSTLPSRRFQYDLQQACAAGLINKAPAPNTVSDYLRNEKLTNILKLLIVKSSLPLADFEDAFAVDSTGLSVPRRFVWFNKHKGRQEKRRGFIKLHIVCGVQTNIVTNAEVSQGSKHDTTYFRNLIEGTARNFKMSEISADAAYISAENRRISLLVGAMPYIAFRRNASPFGRAKSPRLNEMLQLFQCRKEEVMRHYYRRNNVESTFSMMQARLGDSLLSKSYGGQVNEALCQVICHNLSVLVQSMYELKINPTAWIKPELTAAVEEKGLGNVLTEEEFTKVDERIAAVKRKAIKRGVKTRKQIRK